MKQNRPDTFQWWISEFWWNLIILPILLSFALGAGVMESDKSWGQAILGVLSIGLLLLMAWVIRGLHHSGYAQALYAHYLKRFAEKEKAEAAKLYIGRKEE